MDKTLYYYIVIGGIAGLIFGGVFHGISTLVLIYIGQQLAIIISNQKGKEQ